MESPLPSLRRRARRHLLPLYQHTVRELHELNYLFLELTLSCNLACLHCGSDCTRDNEAADLDFDVVLATMREIAERHDPHKITVVLSGGEPLAYPRVFELGHELTKLEFPWGMVTNGFAWNDRAFDLAKKSGMASVTVSLDGLEAEHDWLRGREGSFRRATRTIKRLTEDPFWQAMDVITCANQRNLHTLDEVYEVVRDQGSPGWRIFTISPIGRAGEVPELFLEPDQYHQLMRKILAWRERGELKVALSESGYLGPCLEREVRDHDHFCMAGIRIAGIMCNGDILACPNIDRRWAQGNIHRDSFADVWEQKYQPFRRRKWMKDSEPCASCGEWSQCHGGAFHLWDIDEGRPRLCHFHDFELERFQSE